MNEFTSPFWSWYISIPAIVGIVFCVLLVLWMSKGKQGGTGEDGKVETMGHVWDEDLAELNNPLPSWWRNMFFISIVFGVGYLLLYPGLGSFAGMLGWSSAGNHAAEMHDADVTYGPIYDQFAKVSVADLAKDREATEMGERLFLTYCTACHGSDAGGVTGYPNLRDKDWLWGGEAATIEQTILHGRSGTMPSWEAALGGEKGVQDMTQYVLSLSKRPNVDAAAAERGKAKFKAFCTGCHGADGKGLHAVGAPNLTDNTWLYGGHPKRIAETIAKGRNGRMPAHEEFLGKNKVHVLAAYIYSLSNP